MFKRKPKVEPVWEQQDLLDEAKARLMEMERMEVSKEGDILSELTLRNGQLSAAMADLEDEEDEEKKSEKLEETARIRATIASLHAALDRLHAKSQIPSQRDYVQKLISQKLEWEKEHTEKPMTKSDKAYLKLTAIGLALPVIGEQLGKLWFRHIDGKIRLPWKKK